MAMGSGWKLFLTGLVLLGTAGCATKQEWETWAAHPAHFASGDHLVFSVRNTEGTPPRVTREDLAAAREQGWWGRPVTISQAEILER
ncbi:MAG: hypothetical protein AUH77_14280 [Candidatus Rokubacteria bacterium 13_1_40CM_4_69_39]|jgi:hypothetical protein|nr:MAG: hypothetical protein AUH77_14280 [Candidatus Rokubacteria bacterium 13_1_40CM_4_69_39]OLC89281.1 MAG: hypothetical protein AUJ05_12905 [Candidatus Rokubacteria bacterium 13_1_40CM_3_69_38]OLD76327.1 MAG: hypothetical protein AUG87_09170 [Candidatus Rokubacteria bacterium 13_1_20CM_4_70_14]PYM47418.1 MAG: hypothetical protein DME14_14955 [Candidatus Rokubacteria bacterium]